jgi:hypothetical protein
MKKVFFSVFILAAMLFAGEKTQAQQTFKIGVFDIDAMVTYGMPGYRSVDSLLQIYERDSLGAENDINLSEYKRLDSTYKADSVGGKSKAVLDYTRKQLQQFAFTLTYWQQIAQQKSDNKKAVLAQPLYEQVANAYRKVLAAKKYTLVLKPGSYELGPPIDNLFISVAKELKLTELPQQLLMLGDDPDAPKNNQQPATNKPAGKP